MFQRPSIDMTQVSQQGEFVEILTPGGIVLVNTSLVTTQGNDQVVVVEIEPNMYGRQRTDPGGNWDHEVQEHLTGSRIDVTLTRR